MVGYILRRIFYMILMLLLISFIAFAIIQAMPGSILDYIHIYSEEDVKTYGLNQPFLVQYGKWLSRLLHLDFGIAGNGMPVSAVLFTEGAKWFYSLIIICATMLFAWPLGIAIGICSALWQNSLWDRIALFISVFGIALPNFLLALFLSWILYRGLGIPPVGNKFQLEFLWLYILVIGSASIISIMRHMRSNLIDVLTTDYIRTARAKGLREHVILKHGVRNAINPLISMLGFYIPTLFEGMIVAAAIFNIPIIERAYLEAFKNQDPYVIATGLLFFGIILLAGNLLADLLLLMNDPRIRYEG